MVWKFWFWVLLLLLVIPLPIKLYELMTGKDQRKRAVKLEEFSNAGFMAIGLLGFYGFIYGKVIFTSNFWYSWLIISITWSILAIFYSPKLEYAAQELGEKKAKIAATFSTFIYIPLFIAIYLYASQL